MKRHRFLLCAVLFGSLLSLVPTILHAEDAAIDPTEVVTEEEFSEDEISDPLEGYNRAMFWFNDVLDIYLFEPVATVYDWVTPEFAQTGIRNFFNNLDTGSYIVSDLVQFKFCQLGTHTGRFLINTTLGVGGLIDVADEFGLEPHYEDMATAFAYRGAGPGPYIVLPILGPSNLRDGIGLIFDTALNPLSWTGQYGLKQSEEDAITYGARGLQFVNTRARLLDAIEGAKEASLDYYLFVRKAYYQHRDGVLNDGSSSNSDDIFADADEKALEDDE